MVLVLNSITNMYVLMFLFLFTGGAAEKAGLHSGDKIIQVRLKKINHVQFSQVLLTKFFHKLHSILSSILPVYFISHFENR